MIRALDIWLPSYIKRKKRPSTGKVTDIMFCVCDHFEPFHGTDRSNALRRVEAWVKKYPERCKKFKDTDDLPPKHTFFYPIEQYDEEILNKLSVLRDIGLGEVEMHLHHDNDTETGLRDKLYKGMENLSRHGFLAKDEAGRTRYGFVHGNWALDNSDPSGKNCGVNNEISVLLETGCYADFTMPSAPHPTQTRIINSIYYASDTPAPKSHDTGVSVRVEPRSSAEGHQSSALLMIQGPLALNWRRRKLGLLPRIENGELSGANPPNEQRMKIWIDAGVHVQGRPEWVFIKLHTHGCDEEKRNTQMLLGEEMAEFYQHLSDYYNDGKNFRLHYVTARECVNIVLAAQDGVEGNPGLFRNYRLKTDSSG